MSFFFAIPGPPGPTAVLPKKSTVGGGAYFPRYLNRTLLYNQLSRWNAPLSSFYAFPNAYDLCLTKDWTLYDRIDPLILGCCRKPECFLQDERAWVDTPKGGVIFNPANAIPLPDPADLNTVVLRFKVPFGYDGIILGQYNQYTNGFSEGSGDLVWRVRVDGRYLRDCGNILVTLGSPRQLSPIYGGLQLRSGNVVEYLVSAPNTTGSLPPPGMGNILVGLHGWFYERGGRSE